MPCSARGEGRVDAQGRGTAPKRGGSLAAALATALLLPGSLGGCAKQEAPPGAIEETRPPEIRSISPRPDTVVTELAGPLRIRFDEPIRVRGNAARELVASPAYEYRASVGHSEISIWPEGGWREGAVYVLELPVSISDLLDNRREEPIRVVFSTGPPITGTRVTARVYDRVTGEEEREARVLFRRGGGDTIPYATRADTTGRFALSALPPDEYRAWAFLDRNRDRRLDPAIEPYDSADFVLAGPADTAGLTFHLVEPDSTPPVLVRAEAADSATLSLTFDDPLRPEQELPPDRVVVRALDEEGSPAEPWHVESVRVVRGGEEAVPGDAAAAADTLAADTAAVRDTLPSDTIPAPGAGAADALPLPSSEVRVLLARPLVPGRYRVGARDVRNLRRLAGGGDTVFVYEAPADTAAAPDTAAATLPADTATETLPADTATGSDSLLRASDRDRSGVPRGRP